MGSGGCSEKYRNCEQGGDSRQLAVLNGEQDGPIENINLLFPLFLTSVDYTSNSSRKNLDVNP